MSDGTLASLFPEEAPKLVNEEVALSEIRGYTATKPGRDLLRSVERLGVLSPVLLARKDGLYEIVDGRRRVSAAKKVGLEKIPARVIEGGVLPETVTLQTNFARRSNPISEYVAIRGLVGLGYSGEQIAKELGIKTDIVRKRLRLGKLIPTLYELVEGGYIRPTVGEAAANLPPEYQVELLKRFEENGDRLRHKDVEAVRAARDEVVSPTLADLVFEGPERRRKDAVAALAHLEAAAKLLTALGVEEVSFDELRAKIEAFAK